MKDPVIALVTDFGEDDFFTASMKGVILKINPSVRILDITHRIPSFDVTAAGFILSASFKYFPAQTIFVAVVDPGVGSQRRILLARTEEYYFIGPDNGVLSFVLEEEEVKELREIVEKKYLLPDSSATFEGRDKMAPVAAWISHEVPCSEFGPAVESYEKIKTMKPRMKGNAIVGNVLYEDKFGNLITNIPASLLEEFGENVGTTNLSLSIKGRKISSYVRSYSQVKRGELLFLVGSVGMLEIAAREESASVKLNAGAGDEVSLGVRNG